MDREQDLPPGPEGHRRSSAEIIAGWHFIKRQQEVIRQSKKHIEAAGQRLANSINQAIQNGEVLVFTFNDSNDSLAMSAFLELAEDSQIKITHQNSQGQRRAEKFEMAPGPGLVVEAMLCGDEKQDILLDFHGVPCEHEDHGDETPHNINVVFSAGSKPPITASSGKS